MTLGIVVGLAAEARVTRGLGGVVRVGGGTRGGGQEAAEALVACGVGKLLSFGYAGGLDPALRPGDLLIPARVIAGGRSWAVDASLAAALGGAHDQAILGGSGVLADAEAKRRARAQTGAVAVDLESGAVAEVAGRHRLPFAVLRAICDPAERALPPLAMTALDRKGRVRAIHLLAGLLRRPGQLSALRVLGRDAAAARAALVERVRQIGPL